MHLTSHTPDPTPNHQGSPQEAEPNVSTAAPTAVTHRACPACHDVWPAHMMEQFEERLLCKPCLHNAQTEAKAKAKKRPSYGGHLSAESIRNWGIVVTLLAVAAYLGLRMTAWNMVNKATGDVVEQTQSWAKKPAAQWPPLVTSVSPGNGAKTPDNWQLGPNACLIKRKDGSIVCASSVAERASLSFYSAQAGSKQFPKPPTFQQFSAIVQNCEVSVGKEHAAFGALLPDARGAFEKGLVFFSQPGVKVPKGWEPFHVRESIYAPGMKMTVLARNSKSGAQVPLEAVVVSNNISSDLSALVTDQLYKIGGEIGDGSDSLITLKDPYNAEALIGAPVVDVRGNLAAIITMAYSSTNTDGLTTDFVVFGMHALKAFTAPEQGKK